MATFRVSRGTRVAATTSVDLPPPTPMLTSVLMLVVGLVVLYFGAEALVDGASKIALGFGISPMIVGLTIVALATSLPEFVVSLMATLGGSPNIGVGNVIGSNVANIALIIGASAVIFPMTVERSVFTRDYPIVVIATFVSLGLAATGGRIVRGEGLILLAILAVFLGLCLRLAVQQSRDFKATGQFRADAVRRSKLVRHLAKVVLGLVGLVAGARLMVDNAVIIAREFDVPELVIGVSIVALGTSLPELATSIVAAVKKQPDISLGNILGSNIFNLCFILGGVSMIAPMEVSSQAIAFDFPASALVTLLLFPLMRIGRKLARIDGLLLLASYFAYIALSYLSSTGALGWGQP